LFVPEPGHHPDGHLRARAEGRYDAPFRYGEIEVHPLVIRAELVKCGDLFEYQVRQTPHGIDVDAVAPPGFEPAALATALTAALASSGVPDPTVRVRAWTISRATSPPAKCGASSPTSALSSLRCRVLALDTFEC
jgi:hypothetical protein